MLEIRGFANYFFCPETCKVFSIKNKKMIELKPSNNWNNSNIYMLYKNGVKFRMSLFKILIVVIKDLESLASRE